jgi:hypothetical protein
VLEARPRSIQGAEESFHLGRWEAFEYCRATFVTQIPVDLLLVPLSGQFAAAHEIELGEQFTDEACVIR